MSFSKELFRGVSNDIVSPFNYSLTIINGKAVYVDGFEKILMISSSEISIKARKDNIKIVGEELRGEKMEEFSCVIVGRIGGFYVE